MAYFEWTDQLKLDVPSMDTEHVELIRLMNRLHDCQAQSATYPECDKAFQDLMQFTVKHFTDEEKHMESINFPGLVTHKIIHKDLLEKVTAHYNRFKQNQKLENDLFGFLSTWLNAHIMGIDMKYAGKV